ncbi:hypothetical protein BKA70DRAFT_1268277 [Coprinopsis sp. MPI-PUGE-AT-0042]|nr:hypothetical protein BKA70DRAFT_1268277 [Coprinopsis sp. MPI-PUGE-AT-0042]
MCEADPHEVSSCQMCYNSQGETDNSIITMLLLLLLQLLFSGLHPIEGAPLGTVDFPAFALAAGTNSTSSQVTEAQSDNNTRSIRQIIWACLSVVFACTWTAVHPNVYGYRSTQWQRTKRRTLLFLLALFMPEVNLVWSVKQWIGARDITRRMNNVTEVPKDQPHWWSNVLPGALQLFKYLIGLPSRCLCAWRSRNQPADPAEFQWTDVHSHFLQMGGYIFKFEDGHGYVDMVDLFKPSSSRSGSRNKHAEAMREALLQRRDHVEELTDKSKTNLLARTIAYGQMLWFCANFIGRLVEGLTITKLEVASLAYVAMTLATYYFWMDKPLDVDCPIVVAEETEGCFGKLSALPSLSPHLYQFSSFPDWDSDDILSPRTLIAIGQSILIAVKNTFTVFLNAFEALVHLFTMSPLDEWDLVDNQHADRYPFLTFWEGGADQKSLLAASLSAFSYTAFGGVHCIAWNFAPYSEVEQWLWRVASVTVASVPLLVPFANWLISVAEYLGLALLALVITPAFLVFVPARMVILILPFLELTHLPADAFKTVFWDDFFPHIG